MKYMNFKKIHICCKQSVTKRVALIFYVFNLVIQNIISIFAKVLITIKDKNYVIWKDTISNEKWNF